MRSSTKHRTPIDRVSTWRPLPFLRGGAARLQVEALRDALDAYLGEYMLLENVSEAQIVVLYRKTRARDALHALQMQVEERRPAGVIVSLVQVKATDEEWVAFDTLDRLEGTNAIMKQLGLEWR